MLNNLSITLLFVVCCGSTCSK